MDEFKREFLAKVEKEVDEKGEKLIKAREDPAMKNLIAAFTLSYDEAVRRRDRLRDMWGYVKPRAK